MKKTILLVFLLCNVILGYGQFQDASFMANGYTLPYKVMYPKNYDATKSYPLVLFLHGAGERGSDNEKQLIHGKQFLIENFHEQHSAIVLVPQCPENNYWANVVRHQLPTSIEFKFGMTDEPTLPMQTLVLLVQDWLQSGAVDRSKVYVGGLSMGGMGTFEIVTRMPKTFAAAFPICGGADLGKLSKTDKQTAFWIFHGDADNVVPVQYSRDAYGVLNKKGRIVKYTEYPGVNHGSWNNAFAEKNLGDWLFEQQR